MCVCLPKESLYNYGYEDHLWWRKEVNKCFVYVFVGVIFALYSKTENEILYVDDANEAM